MNTGDETIAGVKTFSGTISYGTLNDGTTNLTSTIEEELNFSDGVTSNIQTQINNNIFLNLKEFDVTVNTKTSNHPYHNQGSNLGYYINSIESPVIHFKSGYTYKFNQSDSSNGNHPILFYLDAAKNSQHTTGVTTSGTAGSSGAYVQITVSDSTPTKLYYQCSNHGYMGNYGGIETHIENLTLTELGYVNGVTSSIQTQINSKQATITAGSGITKSGDTLDVNVDDSTIEITSDTLGVKDSGITTAKIGITKILK